MTNSEIDSIGILLGHENRLFNDQSQYSLGPNFRSHAEIVADFNGDSWLDFVVTNMKETVSI